MEKLQRAKNTKAKKPNKAEQYGRFVATARKLGVDETGESFEHAFRKILPPRKPVTR